MDQSLQDLMTEVNTALAELSAAATEAQSNTGEISETLLGILAAIKAHKGTEAPAPQVNVTVQPAEVTIAPAPTHDWEHVPEYDERTGRFLRIRSTRIVKE